MHSQNLIPVKQDISPVTITSYNSTGFPVQRQLYMNKLQLFSDVICGQEHFQLKDSKYRVVNAFNSDFEVYFKPAFKSSEALTCGRPKGGVYIAWKKCQVKKAIRISCESFRLQAVILEYEKCRLLIFNVYFPCDSKRLVFTDAESLELLDLLNIISRLKQEYFGRYDFSVVIGDLNFDINRFSGHTQAINSFLEREDMFSVWSVFPVDFTFALGNSVSTIDHFIVPYSKSNVVLDAGSIHDSDNLSGHAPIFMKLNLEKACNKSEECRRNPRINWGYSSIEQRGKYCDSLDRKLSSIEYSSPCQNILCSNYSHHQNLDQLTVSILESIMESAWDNLEHTSGTTGDQKSRKFTIPGWNILVKPFQEES